MKSSALLESFNIHRYNARRLHVNLYKVRKRIDYSNVSLHFQTANCLMMLILSLRLVISYGLIGANGAGKSTF